MMPKISLHIMFCLFFLLAIGIDFLQAQKPEWLDWETYQTAMAEDPKKALIYIYTDWCGPCARMDSSTFSDSIILNTLDGEYYSVKFNAEYTQPLNFKGETFDFIFSRKKGFHALAFHLAGQKLSYPCFVILDEMQVKSGVWFGYLKTELMLDFLQFPNQNTEDYPTIESWMERTENK